MAKLNTEPILIPGNKLGIKLDFPEQFLDKAQSPYSRNIEYVDGILAGRGGLSKFDTTQLPGSIMLMEQFYLFDGSNYFMICTNKDVTYYDFTNTYFVYLTPLYQGGLAKIGTGAASLIVTGSNTSWMSEVTAGDYFKLGTGNINSDASWYEVATITTGTEITLLTAPTGTTFQGYTIRKCFAGQTGIGANYWFSTVFQDKNLGETWIGTNGVDAPVKWSATGQVSAVDLSDVSGFTTAKFVSQFKDRLFWGYTTEGSTQPQRIRWSAVADCATYTTTDFEDFMEDQAWITGMVEFSNYFAIMKERGARIGRYVGGDYIFDFEVSTVPVGCYAPNSICSNSDNIYYYGIDNKFHRWNFLREEDVSLDILPWTKDFDPNMEQFVFGWEVEWKNQIRWFVPHGSTSYNNYVVVYDYVQDIIEIWDTAQTQALSCIGEYVRNADIFCDDVVEGEKYADEYSGYADSRIFLDGAPTLVYGGYDGYIRKADSGYDDDGTNYTRKLRTKRLDFRYPVLNKRLWKQEWAFNVMTTGNVTLYLKKGDNEIDDTAIKTIALTSDTKDVIRPKVTWDKEDYTFQFELQSTNHFELIGFLNYWFGKGKEFR